MSHAFKSPAGAGRNPIKVNRRFVKAVRAAGACDTELCKTDAAVVAVPMTRLVLALAAKGAPAMVNRRHSQLAGQALSVCTWHVCRLSAALALVRNTLSLFDHPISNSAVHHVL
jgi:hypothetical protein